MRFAGSEQELCEWGREWGLCTPVGSECALPTWNELGCVVRDSRASWSSSDPLVMPGATLCVEQQP